MKRIVLNLSQHRVRCVSRAVVAGWARGGGWLVVGWLVCGLGVGCGYTHKELFPDHVATVTVPIFGNRSFYQGMAFDLTEALVKEIELRTPYKVTAEDDADTILTGTIVSVRQDRLSRHRAGDVPQELEMRITVDFEWKNLRTGRTLRQRRGYTAVGRYIPVRPIREPSGVAQHAAVQRLARNIVSVMASDW